MHRAVVAAHAGQVNQNSMLGRSESFENHQAADLDALPRQPQPGRDVRQVEG
jgi:hypothetical protein